MTNPILKAERRLRSLYLVAALPRWALEGQLCHGTDSGGCCAFAGGPFVESRYFGEGVGVAVKRGNDTLRLALNWALFRLWEKGRFTDLWLRYFPINPY